MAAGRTIRFFAFGLISAVVSWGGVHVFPEGHWIADVWPGFALGCVIAALLQREKYARFRWFSVALLVTSTVVIVGWRLAIHTAIALDGPVSMAAAGAVGGVSVAMAAALLQRNRHNILSGILVLLATGAVAAALFDLTNYWAGRVDSDPWWTLQLFVTWQPLVLSALAWVAQPPRSRLAPP